MPHTASNARQPRFPPYTGVNAKGKIVRELTGGTSDVEIAWTVQVANTKAAWYRLPDRARHSGSRFGDALEAA